MNQYPTLALIKAIELETGAFASYWKVVGLAFVEGSTDSNVIIAGWLDRKAHDAGKKNLSILPIKFGDEVVKQFTDRGEFPVKQELYQLLATSPIFKEAQVLTAEPVPSEPAAAAPVAEVTPFPQQS